jgi:hypothetical protein
MQHVDAIHPLKIKQNAIVKCKAHVFVTVTAVAKHQYVKNTQAHSD